MATSGQYLFSELLGHADSIDFDKAEVEGSIPQRFARQASNRRNAFAAKDAEQAISYSQLDALSNQIAHRLLKEYGPQPLRVGLCFPLSVESVAAHLGVWKAGKTCVPIDPQFPSTRAAEILADAQADVAIAAQNQLEQIQNLDTARDVLELNSMSQGMPENAPGISVAAIDPAAILYISGAAGRPTGIVHTHRSLLHRCWSDTQYFQITQRDHISLLTSPGFGAGIPQILSALLNGATLYPFDLQTRNFEELYDWLWTERITLFYPPVFAFRQFLEGCPAGERYDDCRYVVQAGAPTLATTIESWKKHFPPSCALVCQLTSTETQVVSRYSIAHDQELNDRYMTTGYADCDKQLSIVDSDGKPVARGAIGELVVSSKYLSAGIWSAQRGQAIAHANPTAYQNLKGVPSIHTRDLVSLDARGRLRHHGRSDSAVKLRGYRIDVSEIEAALMKRGDIAETVCVTRELENHRRQMVAFYVPTDSPNKPGDVDLRHWLRGYLPDYMLPARFLSVPELPRTINGKIARRAVENLEIVQRSRGADLHSFENELQRRFVEIWRSAIGHEDIGIDDDFFDIGGDTMSALQVSAAVSRCIGRHVPFSQIIERRNIRRLVEYLDRTDEPITCISLLPGTSKIAARRPLFCIEGLYLYRQLAEALGPDRETIGVLARPETHLLRTCSAAGRSSGQPAGVWPPSVEQLAATYIEEIRKFQRSGPYQLAGAGFGGVIAFEMARQLTAGGDHVSMLGILDSLAPRSVRPVSTRGWLTMTADWVKNSIPMSIPDARTDRATRERHRLQSQAVALMRYKPSRWHGNVVLFASNHAARATGMQLAENLGWNNYVAGQLSAHRVQADQRNLLRTPAVQDIATTLRPFLDSRH